MLAVAEKAEVATTVDATTETHILDKVKILIAKELPSLIADALKQNHTADHPTITHAQTPLATDTPPATSTPLRITESPSPPPVQHLPEGSTDVKLDFMYRELKLTMDHTHQEMLSRFEAVNQRFADLIHYSDKRFEDMNKRFEEMQRAMDKRFEDMNKRFEEMQRAMDKRFEDMNKRFNSLQWMIGTGIALVAALMTIYRFVG